MLAIISKCRKVQISCLYQSSPYKLFRDRFGNNIIIFFHTAFLLIERRYMYLFSIHPTTSFGITPIYGKTDRNSVPLRNNMDSPNHSACSDLMHAIIGHVLLLLHRIHWHECLAVHWSSPSNALFYGLQHIG